MQLRQELRWSQETESDVGHGLSAFRSVGNSPCRRARSRRNHSGIRILLPTRTLGIAPLAMSLYTESVLTPQTSAH